MTANNPNRFQVEVDLFSSEYPMIQSSESCTKLGERTILGQETFQIYYRGLHAPACDIASREMTKGTQLQRLLNPGSYYSGRGGEFDLINSKIDIKNRSADWLGLQSRVYLIDCFNFQRVANHFGYSVQDIMQVIKQLEPTPTSLMRKHPLTVVGTGRFSGYRSYLLRDDLGKEITLWDGVKFVPAA